ncbi:MAG: type II toxin-antitoxin system VapC family toxin [Acidimicrobiia bacterium]
MIADTSVWIDHLRRGNAHLAKALNLGTVLMHPFIVGELACGNLRNREELLSLLQSLPPAPVADHDEALYLIDSEELHGRGIGWVDVHFLASARLAGQQLWTLDRRLATIASDLGL